MKISIKIILVKSNQYLLLFEITSSDRNLNKCYFKGVCDSANIGDLLYYLINIGIG